MAASSAPSFTEAELALADTVILIMKVMAMRGMIDEEGINTVLLDLLGRYQRERLHSAAAMAEYLRRNTLEAHTELSLKPPEGSA